MKMKRALCFVVSVIMIFALVLTPVISYATVFLNDTEFLTCPGHPRAYTKTEDYNYAWLDNVILRDDKAVSPLVIKPVPLYSYRMTADEFVNEVNEYTSLFGVTEDYLQDSIIDAVKTMYYSASATGYLTASASEMRAFNESRGIVYPTGFAPFTDLYSAVTYICLKDDLAQQLIGSKIVIPSGTTVEGAVVRYLAKVTEVEITSQVNNIEAFSLLFAEKYVLNGNPYPISQDPGKDEIYYWVMLCAAEKGGYEMPVDIPYSNVTQDKYDYVKYAFFGTILGTKYGVKVAPLELRDALKSGGKKDVARLILVAMLDKSDIYYDKSTSFDTLFNKACEQGYFDFEDEFYSNIYDYQVFISSDRDKVWITPFLLCDQLENGDFNDASIYINGKKVTNHTSVGVSLENSESTVIQVKINYVSSTKNDTATYNFAVIKDDREAEVNQDIVIDFTAPIGEIVSNALDMGGVTLNNTTRFYELTTTEEPSYSYNVSTFALDEEDTTVAHRLQPSTYAIDESGTVTSVDWEYDEEETEQEPKTVFTAVASAVKENPAIAATPVGFVAVGASVGYVLFKKRKEETDE